MDLSHTLTLISIIVGVLTIATGAMMKWVMVINSKVSVHDEQFSQVTIAREKAIAAGRDAESRLKTEISEIKAGCEYRTANYTKLQAAVDYIIQNQNEFKVDVKELSRKLDKVIFARSVFDDSGEHKL